MDNTKVIISELGRLLNLPVLLVERNPVDPDYDRKVNENLLRLTRPIYLYSIKQVIITETKVITNANNNKVVQFNDDPDMTLPIMNVNKVTDLIPEPNAESVKNAILASVNGGKKTLFTNYTKLYKEVAALNIDSKAEWDRELALMLQYSKTFTQANDIEKTACEKHLKEMGIDPNGVL